MLIGVMCHEPLMMIKMMMMIGVMCQEPMMINIAKGTTDPRVEFISQDHSSQLTNLEHIRISKS